MRFLVLLNDDRFGDSDEEKYTVLQVKRHLINKIDLEVVDVIETSKKFLEKEND